MNVVYLTFSLHILANSCFPHVIKYITIEGEGKRVRGSVQLSRGVSNINKGTRWGGGKVSNTVLLSQCQILTGEDCPWGVGVTLPLVTDKMFSHQEELTLRSSWIKNGGRGRVSNVLSEGKSIPGSSIQ